MRVTSQIWVDVYLRRICAGGNFGCVVKRGAEGAGAIFVILNHLDGEFSLFGPAPQSVFTGISGSDRLFSELLTMTRQTEEVVLKKLENEKRFDPDIWIVENEDRKGRSFLAIVSDIDQ